jgi:hypothetical protein
MVVAEDVMVVDVMVEIVVETTDAIAKSVTNVTKSVISLVTARKMLIVVIVAMVSVYYSICLFIHSQLLRFLRYDVENGVNLNVN